jgi:hypothetical protein
VGVSGVKRKDGRNRTTALRYGRNPIAAVGLVVAEKIRLAT